MVGKENSHCRTVFYKFLALVESDYLISRRVSYYAEKMCMTPKYLSALVKDASGRGANDWINDTVILNAKILIKKSDMTVQQVSDMLHFPNPSFFGQYFKRYTGMTPNKFKTNN
jgi:YesN/AraC family two-component response regulator